MELDRAFFTQLRERAVETVPVVGSGLTIEAGVPGFSGLLRHLVDEAEQMGHALATHDLGTPFSVVDQLADALSPGWVATVTARFISDHTPLPTATLRALARVPSKLILTTNYDFAIETAAKANGQPVESLTAHDLPAILQPSETLRVVHLHGHIEDPENLVLTQDSYSKIAKDEAVQLMIRTLAARYQLVFLGHSLSQREIHLHYNLAWTIANFPTTSDSQHLLVADRADVNAPEAIEFKTRIEESARVSVALAEDSKGLYMATRRTAHVLAGAAADASEHLAPELEGIDSFYVSPPVARTGEVDNPLGRGRHLVHMWQHGETYSKDLDATEPTLLLVAGGGFGKSEELKQIGRRSSSPALYQQLNAFDTESRWHDAGLRFVAGMTGANALRPGTPRLTIDKLREESFVFLLDALDEVPVSRRSGVAQLVSEVATEFPQHRYVLTSRPQLDGFHDLPDFTQWSLTPDRSWLLEYCLGRGVEIEDLDNALPDTGDLSELVKIPIYAQAAIGRIHAGEQLPDGALELVLDLADKRMEIDSRVEIEPTQLRVWLDRVALCMVVSGATEVKTDQLINSTLAEDLHGLTDDRELIIKVASRALLIENEGRLRFPVNVIREARAARAILEAERDGLELLFEQVLIELPTTHGDGRLVRAVRPGWVRILEQLLPSAPTSWRGKVTQFDPELVARATATSAESTERHAALWTIWRSYERKRIWIPTRADQGASADEAVRRLLNISTPEGFIDALLAALESSEPTLRGNALRLLPATDITDEQLAPCVQALLTDIDPVVRRSAAVAAHARRLMALVEPMVIQANSDRDVHAGQTLFDFAMDMANDGEVVRVMEMGTGPLAQRGRERLLNRFSRSKILEIITVGDDLDELLLNELLREERFRRETPWSVEDVIVLARLVASAPENTSRDEAAGIFTQHPGSVLLSRATRKLDDHDHWDARRLANVLTDESLRAVIRALQDPTATNLAAAGYPYETIALDEDARKTTLDILIRLRDHPPMPSRQASNVERRPESRATSPRQREVEPPGSRSWKGELSQVAQDLIERRELPRDHPLRDTLREASRRNDALDIEDCKNLVKFLLWIPDPHLDEWLSVQWSPAAGSVVHDLGELPDQLVLRLAAMLPGPWDTGLAERALDALNRADVNKWTKTSLTDRLSKVADEKTIRAWANTHPREWVDPVLIKLGDSAAEGRMIARLTSQLSRVTRYMDSPEDHWVSSLNHASSVPALTELLSQALARGIEHVDTKAICKALSRCSGLRAPQVWDGLIDGLEVAAAPFLIYDKLEAIGELIDQYRSAPRYEDAYLQKRVQALIPVK